MRHFFKVVWFVISFMFVILFSQLHCLKCNASEIPILEVREAVSEMILPLLEANHVECNSKEFNLKIIYQNIYQRVMSLNRFQYIIIRYILIKILSQYLLVLEKIIQRDLLIVPLSTMSIYLKFPKNILRPELYFVQKTTVI